MKEFFPLSKTEQGIYVSCLQKTDAHNLTNYVNLGKDLDVKKFAAAYANDEAGLVETFDKIFDVNLRSNLVLIEYAKQLKKRVNIVVMSSSSSTKGRENLTNYSAAKAALNSIVESQGKVLADMGIYLNAIIPEKIDTPLIGKLHKTVINKRELLDVDEVIDAVIEYSQVHEGGKLVHIRKGL